MSTQPHVSFRHGAFAATAIAGLAVSSLFPSQSLAQTMPMPANYQGTAACAKFANSPGLDKAVQCEARQLDRRIAAEHQRGVDADRRAAEAIQRGKEADRRAAAAIKQGKEADQHTAEAERATACVDFLIAGVKGNVFTKQAVLEAAKGKLTAANACGAARSFGYAQKAELSHPAIQ